MGKMISIWGKGGAGKSIFASNLAYTLAKRGHLVGLLSTNTTYGSIQHYYGMQISDDKSLYKALQAFNDGDIVKNFVPHPNMKDLFVLGIANTDDSLKIENISNEMAKNILLNTKDAFDYYIVDCTDSKYDGLALLSLSYSDVVYEIMRPTVQGIAYHIANEKLMDGLKIRDKTRLVLNCNKNFLGIKDIESKVKTKVIADLPYSVNIERSENTGEPICLAGKIVGADQKYIKAINQIADSLGKSSSTITKKKKISLFKPKGENANG